MKWETNAAHTEQADNKAKAIWNTINNERQGRKELDNNSRIELNNNGKKLTVPKDIANYFNDYFVNIAEETLKQNNIKNTTATIDQNVPASIESTLSSLRLTTADEIDRTIKSLKNSTSASIDEISSQILKTCADGLITPLVKIVNMSMAEGIIVPSQLKIAKVYPKHNQGNTQNISNYRPISILPSISKVIEKIIKTRLQEHLSKNHLLTSSQHGFFAGKSTITAIIDMADFIIENLEIDNTITYLPACTLT